MSEYTHRARQRARDARDQPNGKPRPIPDALPEDQRGDAYEDPRDSNPEAELPTEADIWPDPPAPEAFHGLAGDIVQAILPHSEADPSALLVSLLIGIGNVIGRTAHFRVEG